MSEVVRLETLETVVAEHTELLHDHSDQIGRLTAGQGRLFDEIGKLRQAQSDLAQTQRDNHIDLKLTIAKTNLELMKEAMNTVPARVMVWFGLITLSILVAGMVLPRVLPAKF